VAVITHLDAPLDGLVSAPVAAVRGWVAESDGGPITPVGLVNDASAFVPLATVDRPDVRASLPHLISCGFAGWIDARTAHGGPWRLRYRSAGDVRETALPLRAEPQLARSFEGAKKRKLAAIRPLLRCPLCGAAFDDDGADLRCAAGHRFARSADAYDLLNEEIRRRVRADATDNVSANGYDQTLLGLIAASSGPILDAGAGLRPDYREEVVNLDIVPYPTTDVVAASEHLPFADDTFDLVISVAVLEHVRDPFRSAAELERVLRPGGRIFAAVPFLQPYHGYPHHYYNMTAAGLRNLFPRVAVDEIEVPASGHPVFALSWMLRSWRAALPPQTAAAFDRASVAELAVDPMELIRTPFAQELPAATRAELAALNVLIGRKR
jgi:SAM-dependent methyltransferase